MYFSIKQPASQFPSEDTLHQLDKTWPTGWHKGVRFNIQIPLEGCDYPLLLFISVFLCTDKEEGDYF